MKKKFALRGGTGILLAGLLAFTSAASTLTVSAAEQADSTGLNVAYHTQQEILDRMNRDAAVIGAGLTFSENPVTTSPYAAGSLSQGTLDGAVTMLNQIRYIAGLSDNVALDDEYNKLAQAASLVNYANKGLSHTPSQPEGMEKELYDTGYNGAGSSNIAMASWAGRSLSETIVKGWMYDGDNGNIPMLGHRRWCINPKMGKVGFGAVSGSNGTYSAMYSFDRSNSGAAETGVAWPAQNMPIEYFDATYPWSVSMGSTVDATSVTVTLTKVSDGREWTFSSGNADGYFNVNNGGYGQVGCIIFRPDDVSISAGDSFHVTIAGLSNPVDYTVNFFDESTVGGNANTGDGDNNGNTGDSSDNNSGSGDSNSGDNGTSSGDSNSGDNGTTSGDSNSGDNGTSNGNTNNGDNGNNNGNTNSGDNGTSNGNTSNGGNSNGNSGSSDSTNNSGNTSNTNSSSGSSDSEDSTPAVSEVSTQIANANSGATVKMTGVTTLSNGDMKELLKKGDVTLVLEYTYKDVNYVVTIPANAAIDNDIPWYGPLYLAAHYGNGTSANGAAGSVYTVKAKDTLSRIALANGMTLSQLAAKNPQIKDLNRINIGQQINLK